MTAAGRNIWLLRRPDPMAAARLFCIPYSGCGASMYRRWPARHGDLELVPIQLPGRENRLREPPAATYEELTAGLVDALEPYLDRPYGFFGHCGAALAAYQASVQAERTGRPGPARLYVSAQVAPQDGPAGRFLELDDAGLTAEIRSLIEELGGAPTADVLELTLGILRADIEANRRYVVPDPGRLAAPVTAIGWTQDREVDHRAMSGWTACGDTTFELLPGQHYRFLDGPAELLDLLAAGLGAVAAGHPAADARR